MMAPSNPASSRQNRISFQMYQSNMVVAGAPWLDRFLHDDFFDAEFDAAIALASGIGIVGVHRAIGPEAFGGHAAIDDAFARKVSAAGLGTAPAEVHIHRPVATSIGVAGDADGQIGDAGEDR